MLNQIVASYLIKVTENFFGEDIQNIEMCVRLEDGRHYIVRDNGKGTNYKPISIEEFIKFSNDMNNES